MMAPKPKQPDGERPVRWLVRPPQAPVIARAAELMRTGDWHPTLDPSARGRIFAAVRSAAQPRGRRPPALRWALAAAVLLMGGAVIASATVGRWPRWLAPTITALPAAPPAVKKTSATHGARRLADATAAAPEPAPAPVVIVPLAPAGASVPSAPPPSPAPPTRSPARTRGTLSDESELLGQAIVHLRQQHDAPAALGDLDLYAARFPHGTLKREATIARVDALLSLRRQDSALALLRRMDLQAQNRDQELRVIRGELAAADDCRAALADFDRVLSESPDQALTERALYGRAGCRLRQGDRAGAAGDLEQYLRRFPHGRFAVEASQARAAAEARP